MTEEDTRPTSPADDREARGAPAPDSSSEERAFVEAILAALAYGAKQRGER
jgi:hypothetical protein